MQLPRDDQAYPNHYRFGRYVVRRLRTAGLHDLADSCRTANDTVKTLGRAWEDAEDPLQDALADRDAADESLDTTCQNARLQLASRSMTAGRENPYLLIFHSGIEYYTLATVDQQVNRYRELASRLLEALPETDPVRQSAVPQLQSQIATYSTAASNLASLRTAEAMARTSLETALDDWANMMEKLYGSLISQLGKARAERFFPRIRRRTSESAGEPASS